MARIGRNDPCPCGSGRKAKRCCGTPRGPSEEALARASLAGVALQAALVLRPLSDDDLVRAWDAARRLPELHLSLHFPLPALIPAPLHGVLAQIAQDDFDLLDDPVERALEQLDTAVARAALAREVVALRDRGQIDGAVAAAAVLDLAGDPSELLEMSLVEAAAVATGEATTPGGLIVANRFAA